MSTHHRGMTSEMDIGEADINQKLINGLKLDHYDEDIYIFDMDGTICNSYHRHHFLNGPGPKDWDGFFAAQDQDDVFEHIKLIMKLIWEQGKYVIIWTARPENQRQVSREWLDKHDVMYDCMIMRPNNCREDDTTLKLKQFDQYLGEHTSRIKCIFEDRSRIVVAMREAGYRVLQCDTGDF